MTADTVPTKVATSPGAMIAVGLTEPAAARTPIIVDGISCTPEVVMAMNVTIGLLAVSLSPFSSCSSSIALIPNGVAALFSPSMLAAIATTMAPEAGWPGGTSGNIQRSNGRSARPSVVTSPAASAMRMIPSQSVMTPTRPIEISTAVDAESTAALVTASAVPLTAATTSDSAISPNQM